MKIGEVSKELDIPSATLRYYEHIGLLENIKKKSGIREYQEEDIERIRFIMCMKQAGFSLEAIVEFVKLGKDSKNGENKRLEMLLKQKEILIEEIKKKEDTLDFLNYKIDIYKEKVSNKKIRSPKRTPFKDYTILVIETAAEYKSLGTRLMSIPDVLIKR